MTREPRGTRTGKSRDRPARAGPDPRHGPTGRNRMAGPTDADHYLAARFSYLSPGVFLAVAAAGAVIVVVAVLLGKARK